LINLETLSYSKATNVKLTSRYGS